MENGLQGTSSENNGNETEDNFFSNLFKFKGFPKEVSQWGALKDEVKGKPGLPG